MEDKRLRPTKDSKDGKAELFRVSENLKSKTIWLGQTDHGTDSL